MNYGSSSTFRSQTQWIPPSFPWYNQMWAQLTYPYAYKSLAIGGMLTENIDKKLL